MEVHCDGSKGWDGAIVSDVAFLRTFERLGNFNVDMKMRRCNAITLTRTRACHCLAPLPRDDGWECAEPVFFATQDV